MRRRLITAYRVFEQVAPAQSVVYRSVDPVEGYHVECPAIVTDVLAPLAVEADGLVGGVVDLIAFTPRGIVTVEDVPYTAAGNPTATRPHVWSRPETPPSVEVPYKTFVDVYTLDELDELADAIVADMLGD